MASRAVSRAAALPGPTSGPDRAAALQPFLPCRGHELERDGFQRAAFGEFGQAVERFQPGQQGAGLLDGEADRPLQVEVLGDGDVVVVPLDVQQVVRVALRQAGTDEDPEVTLQFLRCDPEACCDVLDVQALVVDQERHQLQHALELVLGGALADGPVPPAAVSRRTGFSRGGTGAALNSPGPSLAQAVPYGCHEFFGLTGPHGVPGTCRRQAPRASTSVSRNSHVQPFVAVVGRFPQYPASGPNTGTRIRPPPQPKKAALPVRPPRRSVVEVQEARSSSSRMLKSAGGEYVSLSRMVTATGEPESRKWRGAVLRDRSRTCERTTGQTGSRGPRVPPSRCSSLPGCPPDSGN